MCSVQEPMRRLAALLSPLLYPALSCGTESVTPREESSVVLFAQDARLEVFPDARLELTLAGRVVLQLPKDALGLGLVTQVDGDTNYDPYQLLRPGFLYLPPADLVWEAPTALEVVSFDAAGARIAVTYPSATATLSITPRSDARRFDLRLTPDGDRTAYIRIRTALQARESVFGLGETFDDVDHRGKVRSMQLEVDEGIESVNNEAHVPIPFALGTSGFGLLVESMRPGAFDVGATQPDRMDAIFGVGVAASEGLLFHLSAEAHPLDSVRHYYQVTGKPRLPAPWAFGVALWRNENRDQAEVISDLEAMRALDLPTSVVWIDRPYQTAVGAFDFEAARFPEPEAITRRARDLGYRLALWHVPYFDEEAEVNQAAIADAEARGFFPPQIGVLLNSWGRPIDFTAPGAIAHWQEGLSYYTRLGYEGFKLDYGEDIIPGISSRRTPWRFFDGSDEQTMHARYQLLYHQTYADLLPESGGFLLCRRGAIGDQTNGTIIWPGDLDASFARHREQVADGEDGYVAVGGLPASIVAGISLGAAGFPFYGSDTGGYRHGPPDKELFLRWAQQTSLWPIMQVGNASSTVPWEADPETGFDQELLDAYREYARLHVRLFPFFWTLANRLVEDGRPIGRPLRLAFPDLPTSPNDQYMLGDAILVAPVVDRGGRERSVVFPLGEWIRLDDGTSHVGPITEVVDAPLTRIPAFIARGAIVPLLRPSIDTLSPASDPAVDSFARDRGRLHVWTSRGPSSSFVVYDGTRLEQGGRSLRISPGKLFDAGYAVEWLAADLPSGVRDGDRVLAAAASLQALEASGEGWFYDAEARRLLVMLPPGAHDVALD